MMSSFGRDTSNDLQHARFYGAPSGLAFLQRTEEVLTKSGHGPNSGSERSQSAILQLFDPPSGQHDWDDGDLPSEAMLPTRDTALKLLTVVLTAAYPLFPICDEPILMAAINQVYNGSSVVDEKPSQTTMALLHIVLGLGYLFSTSEHRRFGCDGALKAARRHYVSAYKLTDFSDCGDFPSLQLLLSFTVFQISVSRLASAHAIIAQACSSALRLGLHHRSTHHSTVSREDRATRRTVFWTVIKLDMYLSAVLGLPPFIDLRQVDPALDLTLAEAITEAEASLPDPAAAHLAISAKHLELMRLIARAIKVLYPMPDPSDSNDDPRAHTSIRLVELTQIEQGFKTWHSEASQILRKGDDESVGFARSAQTIPLSLSEAKELLGSNMIWRCRSTLAKSCSCDHFFILWRTAV
ncbi:uncharacterized protein A1O9_02709 [Exophiala aquamarina CBS 119918]|uniref:Xylanolytic transcriptional activator regulatory domain-containing protein n=1 Tax=Exophiala aquamarina CBS 119918 TaxID=1182545 RepID=A0A072PM20_9EURO|nr:uncharacterized protein A1O9_02709 [Exophiala aquamarina CBS 119918]KEF61144.1 hypothetical protein A1O9_02709 [Exophiala aquamarina CBS 119918]